MASVVGSEDPPQTETAPPSVGEAPTDDGSKEELNPQTPEESKDGPASCVKSPPEEPASADTLAHVNKEVSTEPPMDKMCEDADHTVTETAPGGGNTAVPDEEADAPKAAPEPTQGEEATLEGAKAAPGEPILAEGETDASKEAAPASTEGAGAAEGEAAVTVVQPEPSPQVDVSAKEAAEDLKAQGQETPASPVATTPRKRRKHDFEFGRVLGEGSFGQVLEAVEIANGRKYAVKILSKEHVAREKKIKYVTTERDLLDLCKHPNIVRLYYTFSDPVNLYFVMELATQGELLTWLRTLEVFDLKTTQFYMGEMTLALEFIHSLDVIHRDIKPENILLDDRFHIKLTDFGTAKRLEKTDDPTDKTKARSNSFLGTAEYVSPELLKHKFTCKSSDNWSLGCIMYQLLTGVLPFHAPTDYLIFRRIQKREVQFPEDLDAVAKDMIEKLLALDPEDRMGANDYAAMKAHDFFAGLEFDKLWEADAPDLSQFKAPERPERPGPVPAGGGGDGPSRSMQLAMQQESQWVEFVAADEVIVKDGLVVKKKGLSSKKRVLILTDAPRLFYIDHKKNNVKGEIPWSDQLTCELRKGQNFFIHTPGRSYNLTDEQGNAAEWIDAIQTLQKEKK